MPCSVILDENHHLPTFRMSATVLVQRVHDNHQRQARAIGNWSLKSDGVHDSSGERRVGQVYRFDRLPAGAPAPGEHCLAAAHLTGDFDDALLGDRVGQRLDTAPRLPPSKKVGVG